MAQTPPHQRKEQVKEFTKRLVINAVKNILPIAGPAQLALDIAQDFYDIFLSATPSDQEALVQAAAQLSEGERAGLIEELERVGGAEAGRAARGVIETLRAAPSARGVDQLRQSVNMHMLGGRGFSPRPLTPQQRAIGSAVASSMMAPMSSGGVTRAPHPSMWPQVAGYELKGFLGAGAFAQVFLAQELNAAGEPSRSCALKIGELHDRGRFQREVRALESVSHPNVIDFYGAGVIETPPPARFWIAMPNLSGLTLSDLMRQGLDNEQKLLLSLQLLSGLEALHAGRVCHRDLKPDNALISDDFELKLTDFGLSKDEGGGSGQSLATMQGEMMGTPAYMSPEQADGKPSGAEADVWSFGVLVFELFTGELLFQGGAGESVARVFSNVLNQPIKLKHKRLPTELEAVLSRCINRDLQERFSNARALAKAFRPVAEELRKRLRHQRYRGSWTSLIEGRWLERFAEECRGQLPADSVGAFVQRWPEASAVDPERLAEVLPVVFEAQQHVERARQAQASVVDWSVELQRAEAEAVAQLNLRDMSEAISRAGEVEAAKVRAREAVARRQAEHEAQARAGAQALQAAQGKVSEAVRSALRDELADYDELLQERARARQSKKESVQKAFKLNSMSKFEKICIFSDFSILILSALFFNKAWLLLTVPYCVISLFSNVFWQNASRWYVFKVSFFTSMPIFLSPLGELGHKEFKAVTFLSILLFLLLMLYANLLKGRPISKWFDYLSYLLIAPSLFSFIKFEDFFEEHNDLRALIFIAFCLWICFYLLRFVSFLKTRSIKALFFR